MAMDHRVWVIHMRRLRHEAQLVRNVEKGFVAIGFKSVALAKLRTREEIAEELSSLPNVKPGAIAGYASQL